jgi:hypothetical protein
LAARCCGQALRSAHEGLRSGPARNNDISSMEKERREKERKSQQYPSGILVVVEGKE